MRAQYTMASIVACPHRAFFGSAGQRRWERSCRFFVPGSCLGSVLPTSSALAAPDLGPTVACEHSTRWLLSLHAHTGPFSARLAREDGKGVAVFLFRGAALGVSSQRPPLLQLLTWDQLWHASTVHDGFYRCMPTQGLFRLAWPEKMGKELPFFVRVGLGLGLGLDSNTLP